MIDFGEVITDTRTLVKRYIIRNGYVFTAIKYPYNVYDAIVIKYPQEISCASPVIDGSIHSLEDHIDFINEHKITKALIITDRLDFLKKCPTLVHLRIIPGDNSGNDFDYSPLYEMSAIKSLQCQMVYGIKGEYRTLIDYSRIIGLESISVSGTGHENFNQVDTLKSFGVSGYTGVDLKQLFTSQNLDTLTIIQSRIRTLEGLQKSDRLQCLYLYHNRALKDISALRKVKNTIRALRIDGCAGIEDFSVLEELEKLELLELSGSNSLKDLEFIKKMKNLKTFVFSMNVISGDLSPCMRLSYAYSEKNRRHYNLKDTELPKGKYVRGNEDIELWRRTE